MALDIFSSFFIFVKLQKVRRRAGVALKNMSINSKIGVVCNYMLNLNVLFEQICRENKYVLKQLFFLSSNYHYVMLS